MSARLVAALLSMLASAVAWGQIVPVRVEMLTPREITVTAGRTYEEPIRFRVVRVDNGAPVPGVHVFISVAVIECVQPDCGLPPHRWYGYWEGAGDAESYNARYIDAYTDVRGEVTTPRLVGGSMRWWYEIYVSVDASEAPYDQGYGNRSQVFVTQVSPLPERIHAVPATGLPGLAMVALVMLLSGQRRPYPVCRALSPLRRSA